MPCRNYISNTQQVARHVELVSGSIILNRQIPNHVQNDGILYLFTKLHVIFFLFLWCTINSCFSQSDSCFYDIGYATFYAQKFEGRLTASGKIFSNNNYTCAHKFLPFGTKLKVTRLDTERFVIVEVTDRGPFYPKNIIDLSQIAAQKLNMIEKGRVKVAIEVYEE